MAMIQKNYIYKLPMKVRDYEVDVQGIVNNANYLHYMEHTRHEFCAYAGLSFRDMHEQGIDPVLRHVDIKYLTPLRLGEEFTSCINLAREGAKFIFIQDIYNHDGKLSASARISCVTTVNGRLTRGEELAEKFAPYIQPQPNGNSDMPTALDN